MQSDLSVVPSAQSFPEFLVDAHLRAALRKKLYSGSRFADSDLVGNTKFPLPETWRCRTLDRVFDTSVEHG
jgi:hypothetical protein